MIIPVDDKNVRLLDDIRLEYSGKGIKVLVRITNAEVNTEDLQNLVGYPYAISEDISSFDELCELSTSLRYSGIQNIIIGSYS